MEDIQTVLVILLSIGFLILLIISIAVSIVIYKILTNIRRLTQRIDETTEDINEMARYITKKVGPAAASAIMSVMLRKAKSSFKKKGRKYE